MRGEVSDGMILAEDEVALGTDHAGIMLLDAGPEPGTPLADVLPLGEEVLVVDSTGNRPDLLSVYGIAREVAALYDLPLAAMPQGQSLGHVPNEPVAIEIEDFEGCPRYIGRLFRNVEIAPSPLLAEGATARRGHAPDLERRRRHELRDARARQPAARVRLRHARTARRIVGAARGRARRLARSTAPSVRSSREDLMIADESRAIALAGIMGGAETEIGEGTTNVLLEAANFEPPGDLPHGRAAAHDAPRARTAGSRASTRTSRSLPRTSRRSSCSSSPARRWVAQSDVHAGLPERPVIPFAPADADALIGVATPPDDQHALLGRLGFEASDEHGHGADLARARRARAKSTSSRRSRASASTTCRSRCRRDA